MKLIQKPAGGYYSVTEKSFDPFGLVSISRCSSLNFTNVKIIRTDPRQTYVFEVFISDCPVITDMEKLIGVMLELGILNLFLDCFVVTYYDHGKKLGREEIQNDFKLLMNNK